MKRLKGTKMNRNGSNVLYVGRRRFSWLNIIETKITIYITFRMIEHAMMVSRTTSPRNAWFL